MSSMTFKEGTMHADENKTLRRFLPWEPKEEVWRRATRGAGKRKGGEHFFPFKTAFSSREDAI